MTAQRVETGVRIVVLGPLTIEHGGRELHVAGYQRRRLLAFLASRAGRPASIDAIAEALWGEDLPPTSAKSIQNHVARLRRSFAAVDADLIETTANGYRLAVAPEAIDAVEFELTAAAGREQLASGDAAAAATTLEAALGLWRGRPYDDMVDALFATGEAARLDELRWAAVEDLAEARIETGGPDVALADLQRLVREQPGRERCWGLLIRALYAAGRQRDALAAYQQARSVLVEEFGLEPGPELRELEHRVLEHDPSLAVRRAPSLPATLRRHRGPLHGRTPEAAWLVEGWRAACAGSGQVRVLLGPVDSGRTRLVAELARVAAHEGGQVVYLRADEGITTQSPGSFVDAVIDRSRAAPLLVAVDDAEWSSAADLAALAALAGAIAAAPVLLLVVADPSATGAATQAVTRLGEQGGTSLVLERMDDSTLAELVAADGVDATAVGAVVAVARGLPGVARREAAAWAERAASERLATDSASSIDAATAAVRARASVFDDVLNLVAARARRDELTSPVWAGRQPYRALAWYDVQDADLFVGRERLVAELAARVLDHRLVAVIGASGSGKSSLVRAGLVPLVRSGRLPGAGPWRTSVLVPGSQPLVALDQVPGLDEPGSHLVVVDQFEEVFAAGVADSFANRLVELCADAALDVHLVLVLRSDQYASLASVPRLARLVEGSQVLVGPPSDDELHRIVEVPARRTGCEVDPALTARVVEDVAGRDAALPLVSAALAEVWEGRTSDTLTLDRYDEVGGLAAAVQRMGARAVERIGEAAVREVMLRLVDVTEDSLWIRSRVSTESIPAELTPAVDALVDARLVQRDDDQVDVVHEVVFTAWPLLAGWLEDMRADLVLDRELRSAARAWRGAGDDPDYLYRGARLAAAGELVDRRHVEPVVQEFVAASTGAAERDASDRARHQARVNRRLRGLLAGVALLLVVAMVAGALAFRQAERADESAEASRVEALRADARALGDRARVTSETDLALLLAVAGLHLHDSPETRGNLLAVLAARPRLLAPERSELAGIVAADPAGARLISYTDDRLVLTDAATRDPVVRSEPVPVVRYPTDVEFAPDGRELAVIHDGLDLLNPGAERTFDGRPVALYDGETLTPTTRQLGGMPTFAAGQDVAYSSDGQFVAASFSVFDSETSVEPSSAVVLVWDLSSPGAPVTAIDTGAPFNGVALAPHGEHVVVSTFPPGDVVAFALPTGERIASAPGVGGRMASSPDGTMVAVSGLIDGKVTLLDSATLDELARLEGRRLNALGFPTFSPDGAFVAAPDWEERVVYVWDTASGSVAEELEGHASFVEGIWFESDGSVVAAGDDDRLYRWPLDGDGRFVTSSPPPPGLEPAETPLLSASGKVAFLGGIYGTPETGGTLQVLDLDTGRLGRLIDLGHDGVVAAAWHPGGQRIATVGADGAVRVWDAGTGARVGERILARGLVVGVDYNRAGDRLLVAEEAGGVRSVDAETLDDVGSSFDGTTLLQSLSRGPTDDEAIAITSIAESTSILVLNLATRSLRREIETGFVPWSAVVSPDGTRIAVSGSLGELRLLDAETLEWLGPAAVADGVDFPASTAWSADGRTVVSGGGTGGIALWDGDTGALIGSLFPDTGGASVAAAFVERSTRLLAVGADGSSHQVDTDTTAWVELACEVAGRSLTRDEWREALGDRPYEEICPG